MNYRYKANLTLTGVFLAFGLVAAYRHIYDQGFWLNLSYFVLEAALVGGLADWFAVTALFRKPLGISFHTELIPRNRAKLIDAVAVMVQDELLSGQSITRRIERVGFTDKLITWVEETIGIETIAAQLSAYLERYIRNLDADWVGEKAAGIVKDNLNRLDLPGALINFGLSALEEGKEDVILGPLLDRLKAEADKAETKEKILQLLEEQVRDKTRDSVFKTLMADLLEATDSLNLAEAATALQEELVETLAEIKNPAHPIRLGLRDVLVESLQELSGREAYETTIKKWQTEVANSQRLKGVLTLLVNSGLALAVTPSGQSPLSQWVSGQFKNYWLSLKENTAMKQTIDRHISHTVSRIIESEQYLIGNVVREALNTLTNEDLNKFVEDKAGNDLQWIRINGSLTGGAVGLLLFLFLSFIYDPYVLPVVQNWFGF